MIAYNTMVVLAGASLLGMCAGLVGTYAVLRQRALLGDALAHATLPGLCIAFVIIGERSLPAMLIGALISGILGNVVVTALVRGTRVREDAAIGIVLSVFFGAGIVLTRMIQNQSTTGSKAGLDSYILGKTAGMILTDVYLIAGVSLACVILILLFYKEFQVVCFDAGFARSLGWPVLSLDLLLMTLLAVAVVIGLPSVGVVLIAALLVLPSAAARFWTDSIHWLLLLSAVFGLLIGLVGTGLSANLSLMPAGPVIVLTGTTLFLASLLCGARRGILVRLRERLRFDYQWRERNVLRAAYEWCLANPNRQGRFSPQEVGARKEWPERRVRHALEQGVMSAWLYPAGDGRFQFTAAGWQRALQIVRGQRLWEAFLRTYPEQAGCVADLSHESVDDLLPEKIVGELTAHLQATGRWPTEQPLPQREAVS